LIPLGGIAVGCRSLGSVEVRVGAELSLGLLVSSDDPIVSVNAESAGTDPASESDTAASRRGLGAIRVTESVADVEPSESEDDTVAVLSIVLPVAPEVVAAGTVTEGRVPPALIAVAGV